MLTNLFGLTGTEEHQAAPFAVGIDGEAAFRAEDRQQRRSAPAACGMAGEELAEVPARIAQVEDGDILAADSEFRAQFVGHGLDRGHFAADLPQHIDDMDAAVHQVPAARFGGAAAPFAVEFGALPVGERRLQPDQRADGSLADHRRRLDHIAGHAHRLAVHQRHARFPRGLDHRVALFRIAGQRLLAEDGLSGFRGGERGGGMEMVRQAEIDRFDLRILQQCGVVGHDFRGVVSRLGGGVFRPFAHGIAAGRHAHPRGMIPIRSQMRAADVSASYNRHVQAGHHAYLLSSLVSAGGLRGGIGCRIFARSGVRRAMSESEYW